MHKWKERISSFWPLLLSPKYMSIYTQLAEIGAREHLWINSLESLGKCIFNLFSLLSLPRANKRILPQRRVPPQRPEREAITHLFALLLKSVQIRRMPFWQHLLLLVSRLFIYLFILSFCFPERAQKAKLKNIKAQLGQLINFTADSCSRLCLNRIFPVGL